MISDFFTIQHTTDTQKILKLRAVQLVTNFLNESTDEELKKRISECYLGRIDDSLSLTTDKATLYQIFEYLRTNQKISETPLETFLCFSSDQIGRASCRERV